MLVVSRAWFISMVTSSIKSASSSSTGSLNFSFESSVSLPRMEVMKYVRLSCSRESPMRSSLSIFLSRLRFDSSMRMEICLSRFRYHTDDERKRRNTRSTESVKPTLRFCWYDTKSIIMFVSKLHTVMQMSLFRMMPSGMVVCGVRERTSLT